MWAGPEKCALCATWASAASWGRGSCCASCAPKGLRPNTAPHLTQTCHRHTWARPQSERPEIRVRVVPLPVAARRASTSAGTRRSPTSTLTSLLLSDTQRWTWTQFLSPRDTFTSIGIALSGRTGLFDMVSLPTPTPSGLTFMQLQKMRCCRTSDKRSSKLPWRSVQIATTLAPASPAKRTVAARSSTFPVRRRRVLSKKSGPSTPSALSTSFKFR